MNGARRYLIDEKDIEPDESLAIYRTVLTWAASLGDRFVIGLQPNIYDRPEDAARLQSLGQITVPPSAPEGTIRRIFARLFGKQEDSMQVSGKPDQTFVEELTRSAAPAKAISGDVSPAEDVVIFRDDRRLYASYDYGRTQVLELTDEELNDLKQVLMAAGLNPDRVIPAPPYPERKT